MADSAPKTRDVRAWANGPGKHRIVVEALKARNNYWSAVKKDFMSRLQGFRIGHRLPGALRTFGAGWTLALACATIQLNP